MSLDATRRRTPVRLGVLGLLLVICLLLSAIVLALALRGGPDETVDEGDKIVYGLTLNPSGFDPHIHASSELGIPLFSVYDTLVYRHPQTLDFVPGLAASWAMAPDGLSWTFELKEGVTFHDGTPFNAQAVATNLDRIMNPEIGSQKARLLLGPYSGYEILGDLTIKLYVSEPYAPLLDGLSQVYLGIASPTALAGQTKNSYQWHQVGTGPYRVSEFVPGDHITLRRSEEYDWGPVFYAPETDAAVDTVEFRFYEDAATRSLALESGEVQVIGELLPTDVELLTGNTALRVYPVPVPGTPQQFFINTQAAPTDDLNVRQALIYGTNRTAIVDAVYQGRSPVAHGPLAAVNPFYYPQVGEMYAHDASYARGLLESAGYLDTDGDGILERDGAPLELTMVFGPWNQMPEVAQLIQSQWRDLGIDLELIQVPDFPTLLQHAGEGDYHLLAFSDAGVDASVINRFYLGDSASNYTGYSDPELDGWLLEGVRQTSAETRSQLYASAQQRIMEQALVLPIRDFVNLNGATARLDGVIFSAQGWWPLLRNFELDR
ncbi:MAG: hypothetical protein GXY36_10245 [Chloroflexi bacterium]|nr:hypothetical protein [Chloroflexota bacterium]